MPRHTQEMKQQNIKSNDEILKVTRKHISPYKETSGQQNSQ